MKKKTENIYICFNVKKNDDKNHETIINYQKPTKKKKIRQLFMIMK